MSSTEPTLAEMAEEWWETQCQIVPERDTEEWWIMYEKWIDWSFENFQS